MTTEDQDLAPAQRGVPSDVHRGLLTQVRSGDHGRLGAPVEVPAGRDDRFDPDGNRISVRQKKR